MSTEISDAEKLAIRAVVKYAREAAIVFAMNDEEELSLMFLPEWCFQ